jgi:Protein of unknown function (DUF2934)
MDLDEKYIRLGAHYLWNRRGAPVGDESRDWFQAENQFRGIGIEGGRVPFPGCPIGIFNLYLGETAPQERYSVVSIGPYHVSLIDEYNDVVKQIEQRAKYVFEMPGQKEGAIQPVQSIARKRGSWSLTAIAIPDDSVADTHSILLPNLLADGGLYDLCEILTFLTGRRVTISAATEINNPNTIADCACLPIETLHAAQQMWNARQQLVRKKLAPAMVSCNLALNSS